MEADLKADTSHDLVFANNCCGHRGVFLGVTTFHTLWIDHEPYALIEQEVVCPNCGARGVAKASAKSQAHWPDEPGASDAEKAFSVYAAEKRLGAAPCES
jgi:hypothetical protein